MLLEDVFGEVVEFAADVRFGIGHGIGFVEILSDELGGLDAAEGMIVGNVDQVVVRVEAGLFVVKAIPQVGEKGDGFLIDVKLVVRRHFLFGRLDEIG